MSAELELNADGTARMFYAGEVPWHGLGKGVEHALTSEEAIVSAGLDWEVDLGALFGPDGQPVETGHRAIYRKMDGKVLGIAGSGYHTLQNAEMFDFTDSLVTDGVARYVSAGALFGGRKVWMLMQMDEGWEINGEGFQSYVLMTSGHDCATSVQCLPTSVRVICNNTLRAALRTGKNSGIRIFHNARMNEKLEAARDVMAITTTAQRNLKLWMEQAARTNMVTRRVDYVERAKEKLFGELNDDTPVIKRYVIDQFQTIYDAEKLRNGETAYSFMNAVTGYADHRRWYKGETDSDKAEYRFRSLTASDGGGQILKEKAFKVLASVCPDLPEPDKMSAKQPVLV